MTTDPNLTLILQAPGLGQARGSFAQGVMARGNFLFVSGQGPYDPFTERFMIGSFGEQTRLTLECVDRVLRHAGTSRDRVVSCRVYLSQLNLETFAEMDSAYEQYFGTHKPARTTIGANLLNIDVEIDCIALLP